MSNRGVDLTIDQTFFRPGTTQIGASPSVRLAWSVPIRRIDVLPFAEGSYIAGSDAGRSLRVRGIAAGAHIPLAPIFSSGSWQRAMRPFYAGLSYTRFDWRERLSGSSRETTEFTATKLGYEGGVRWNQAGRGWAVSANVRYIPGTEAGNLLIVGLGISVRLR